MVFSGGEIIDMVIMTLALGFIFKDTFRAPQPTNYDPIKSITQSKPSNFLFAIYITAPAIILHEFGHKFTALAFGLTATFKAAYTWLTIGILIKIMNFPFLFFVPGYVEISGVATHLEYVATAFAGPLVNLLLWLIAVIALKQKIPRKYKPFLILTKKINIFLFFFNMIPIPPFDGSKVFGGLIEHFRT